jgi:hypothetical protein
MKVKEFFDKMLDDAKIDKCCHDDLYIINSCGVAFFFGSYQAYVSYYHETDHYVFVLENEKRDEYVVCGSAELEIYNGKILICEDDESHLVSCFKFWRLENE